MNCSEVRELVSPLIDGELPADDWARAQEHLDRCDTCRRRVRFESDFDSTLRRHLAVRPAPESVVQGARQRLAREFPRRRGVWTRLVLHPAAGYSLAAALLLVLVVPLGIGPALDTGLALPASVAAVSTEGHVVCIECERAGRSAEEQRRCRMFTHHPGIRTEDGRLWTLANLGAGARLGADPELRGAPVRFEGTLYPPIQTVDVTQFEVLPGAS
jgi:hypothetical protein